MDAWAAFALVQSELFLFCAFFFCVGAIDDVAFDALYVWRRIRGRLKRPQAFADLAGTDRLDGPMAIFVPAWREAGVIEATLARMALCVGKDDVTIFVGCYREDGPTEAAVRRAMSRCATIRIAFNDRPGPTTKGDCLNAIWRAMLAEEARTGVRYRAVLLHDAEDMMHADEIAVHRHFLFDHRLSQLPVMPIVPRSSRWLAGHYADEFAEAHLKELRVRHSIGAALPSAGVGCAVRRDYLDVRARSDPDGPFPAASLVEDYELGLSLGADDGQGATLALAYGRDGSLVATRALFPSKLDAVVRQKARWVAGIALAGWDRLGWRAAPGEIWMRLHDRRSILAATVIALSYFLFALSIALSAAEALGGRSQYVLPKGWEPLILICLGNLLYRMVVRGAFVWKMHGQAQALWSLPRTFVANIVAIMASWRAVLIYGRHCLGGPLRWDKTDHSLSPVAADA